MLLKIIKICSLSSKGGNCVRNGLIKGLKYKELFKSLTGGHMNMGEKIYQIDLARR